MKETILDCQAHSMRDNLVFLRILEQADKDPEVVKEFIQKHLKLPVDTIKSITFHWVYHMGGKKPDNQCPRPFVAKFKHFKQEELVKSRGQELRRTDFNNQFPTEILDCYRILFLIRKKLLTEGSPAVIAMGKLYVNVQLYRDQSPPAGYTNFPFNQPDLR